MVSWLRRWWRVELADNRVTRRWIVESMQAQRWER